MMTPYALVLIVHVTAVLLMSAALGIEALSLAKLRASTTQADSAPWLHPVPKLSAIAFVSILTILISGIYLVRESSHLGEAWPKVAAGMVLLMAPLGAITSRRMQSLRRAFTFEALQAPFLKISLAVRITAFFGIFLLVSTKPGTAWESVALLAACLAVGLLVSALPLRYENAGLRNNSTIS